MPLNKNEQVVNEGYAAFYADCFPSSNPYYCADEFDEQLWRDGYEMAEYYYNHTKRV